MTPLQKLHRDFSRYWMSHAGFTRDLDEAVRNRQKRLLAKKIGTSELVDPPYTVDILVGDLCREVKALADPVTRQDLRRLLVDVVLTAELVASALCPEESAALGIYPSVKPSRDREWCEVHTSMAALRNAMLHPGAILPGENNNSLHLGSVVDSLWKIFEGDSETTALADMLERSPASLLSMDVARWAVTRLHAIGVHDGDRAGLEWPQA